MSASRLKRLLGPVNVGNATTTILTVPAAHIYNIRYLKIVNATGGAISIKLGISGTADANLITNNLAIPAGESYIENDMQITIEAAELIKATTTATGLTITINGIDESE